MNHRAVRESDVSKLWQLARENQRQGKLQQASLAYQELAAILPGQFPVWYNLGLTFQDLKEFQLALAAYERALKIKPSFAPCHVNIGNTLQALGEPERALTHYSLACSLDATLLQAHLNKGLLEMECGRLTDAAASLATVVTLNPADDESWSTLFTLLFGLQRKKEAMDMFVQWERQPASLNRLAAGLLVARLSGDHARESHYLDELEAFPFTSYSPLQLVPILGNLQYFDVKPDVQLALYRRFDRAFSAQGRPCPTLMPRGRTNKIRIGYVSPDFRNHVMGRIIHDILSAHDSTRFEVHLFSLCNPRFLDEHTELLKSLATTFSNIADLKDVVAAQLIADHGIDVLVDLAGHTNENRPGIYALRPARTIVTHLGYHGCLGLQAVDYKLTDAIADTPESVAFQIERPYALDCCVMPFNHVAVPPDAPSRDQLREAAGVGSRTTIGCFLNPVKLSPRCLTTWKTILSQAPDAVLLFSLLKSEDREIVLNMLRAHGIRAERVAFLDTDKDTGLMRARYRAVDLVLDTFPYAGGDTTMAALDMDVPVVTLTGQLHAHRVGHSILFHLGYTENIAFTEEEYVAKAVELANDPAKRMQASARIALAKKSSPLVRPDNHTRALERAYEHMVSQQERNSQGPSLE